MKETYPGRLTRRGVLISLSDIISKSDKKLITLAFSNLVFTALQFHDKIRTLRVGPFRNNYRAMSL